MVSKLVNKNQKEWDLHILKVLFAYRTALHESTGYSPFRVTFGRSPVLPVDLPFCRMEEEDEMDIPQFVQDATWTLKHIYEDIH